MRLMSRSARLMSPGGWANFSRSLPAVSVRMATDVQSSKRLRLARSRARSPWLAGVTKAETKTLVSKTARISGR